MTILNSSCWASDGVITASIERKEQDSMKPSARLSPLPSLEAKWPHSNVQLCALKPGSDILFHNRSSEGPLCLLVCTNSVLCKAPLVSKGMRGGLGCWEIINMCICKEGDLGCMERDGIALKFFKGTCQAPSLPISVFPTVLRYAYLQGSGKNEIKEDEEEINILDSNRWKILEFTAGNQRRGSLPTLAKADSHAVPRIQSWRNVWKEKWSVLFLSSFAKPTKIIPLACPILSFACN